MLTVVCWKWGDLFAPVYVNRLRSMLARNLRITHELVCITRNAEGIDDRVRIVTPPTPKPTEIRCRRRMWQFATERMRELGDRILAIDLDVVIVDDITPLVNRPERIVAWRVGYANVYSGSFLLFDAGALDGAWRSYEAEPATYPLRSGEINGSDQAMVNYYLRGQTVAEWTERDGLITWFGNGYDKLEHNGMGPSRSTPPPGTRVVVMGSADKKVMDEGRYSFVRDHWK